MQQEQESGLVDDDARLVFVYLSGPDVKKVSEDAENSRFKVGASTMRGWRVSQEDAHNVIVNYDGDTAFFAVYDGHGGSAVAKYAARHLPDFIKNNDKYKEGKISEALGESIVAFDATLVESGAAAEMATLANDGYSASRSVPTSSEEEGADGGSRGPGVHFNGIAGNDSGCTAIVAVVRGGSDLYVANVGDSRCVVCRGGRAVEMSVDHSPVDEAERERILRAGGRVSLDGRINNDLNLSRALGDHAYKANASLPPSEQIVSAEPDVRTLTIDPMTDSFMVLACDGIWNAMSSQEVVNFVDRRIRSSDKMSAICEELLDHCLSFDVLGDGSGCDNMTAIVVKFSNIQRNTGCCRFL